MIDDLIAAVGDILDRGLSSLAYNCLLAPCTQVAVSSNNLGVEGGKALADCLKSNTTITQVCYACSCACKLQNTRKNQLFRHL